MDEKETIRLPEELLCKWRELSLENDAMKGALKVAMDAYADHEKRYKKEVNKIWDEATGCRRNMQWVADLETGVITRDC